MDLTQNESSNEDPLSHCRACLSSDVRLFNMHQYKLDNAFANITGISVDKDQLQQYLCVYCGTQVLKSASFRDMCLRAHQSLTSEQAKDKINIEVIRKINSSNQFLDLTLTEIQIIECIDIASAETAIESIDVIPADTAIESIDVTPANTAIESIDVTPANAAIECIDVTPANTAIGNIDVTSSVDIPPTDTTITCIDTTDIDLPLNDIDPEDINITLEPNLDFADIEEKKRRNNQPKNGYKNKKPVLNISNNKNLKTNVKSVGKKNDEKISYEILKVLNANDNLHKQSVKLDQTDGITEKTDSKPSVMRKRRIEDSKTNDEKLKLNKKRKIRNPNVKFVGVDGIIKKIDSKVEYENQMQVLNISKDKLKYIKSRMRTIGDSLKKKMKIVIGENNDGSPGDIKINVETKTNVEVNGVSNVGIIRMPIKMRQENLRKDALKKIDMKMMLKSRKKIARYKIRRKPENNYLPVFDFAKFESDYNVKIVTLSKEEQLEEIASRKKSKKYSYQCEACGKGFNMELAYNNHIIRHNPSEGAFSCEICSIRFRRNCYRQKHQDTHRLKYICQSCDFVSRQREQAQKHHAMHEGKTFQCRHCGKTFLKRTSCFSHMRLAHPTLNVTCNLCGETFIGLYGLRHHQKITHAKKRQEFKCAVCSATFLSVEALNRHTDTAGEHGDLRPCEQCGENCASEQALQEHVKDTHPEESYRCDECDISFPNASAFNTHKLRKHLGVRYAHSAHQSRQYPRTRMPNEHGSRVCEQCGRVMKSAAHLRYHLLRDHQNVKLNACSECPKRFFSKALLRYHMRSHTGERPFQCPACPRAFSLKANFKRHHLTAHEGLRNKVPCHICGREFTTKNSMAMHVSTVHGGRPWPRRDRSKRPKNTTNMTRDKTNDTKS